MISTKEDLRFYLCADSFALGYKRYPHFRLFKDNLRYERYLRLHEYFHNNNWKIPSLYFALRQYLLGRILGFSIPINVFDAGLRINHHGVIIINSGCQIGKWCDIHNCVNIGDNGYISDNGQVIHCIPIIGDHVHICPGAKIFGEIRIGNNVVIGSNAVINCDIPDNCIVVGNPVIIKEKKKRILSITDKSIEQSFISTHPEFSHYLSE